MDKEKSLAFSGYRNSKLPEGGNEKCAEIIALKDAISEAIENAINEGYVYFLTGMADGFDTFAAEALLEARKQHPNIQIIAVLAFDNDKNPLLSHVDDKIVTAGEYSPGVYHKRNDYMINSSSRLICYYDGRNGGTEYTFNRAKKLGLEIINLAYPKDGAILNIDNITETLGGDLDRTICKSSIISVAAETFSIYAYDMLKCRLRDVKEFRFIFTSPTFVYDKLDKEKREFYIPRIRRQRDLYGTEFEVRLRNKLTQRAIGKDCVEWIRKKATFKTNITDEKITGFLNVQYGDKSFSYFPIQEFTTIGLGCSRGNNIFNFQVRQNELHNKKYLDAFESLWNSKAKLRDVTEAVAENISNVYRENSPEYIYFVTLYNIFSEFLEDLNEDILPDDKTGFKNTAIWNKLYSFQRDAALSIISKLEKHNGCILADSVGLGKTFTALAVIKYYELRNMKVLVLCPKKLRDNWNTYNNHYINNPLEQDKFSYDVFYHTDLSRDGGESNGKDLSKIAWRNYNLVVIDESHNFRNGGSISDPESGSRYVRLVNRIIRPGVKTKVLMLSATPVNNRFGDLKNQLALAYNDDKEGFTESLNITNSVDEIFRKAQATYNEWERLDTEKRTTKALLNNLDYDFFELLDSVTIARSRKHIERYYNIDEIGGFPERMKPLAIQCGLSEQYDFINFNTIFNELSSLNLKVYKPTEYLHESAKPYYSVRYDIGNFKQIDREEALLKLMRVNLLKRLESSVKSFALTVKRIIVQIDDFLAAIDCMKKNIEAVDFGELDIEDVENDELIGTKVQIKLSDMDYVSWKRDMLFDRGVLQNLLDEVRRITPEYDLKLLKLIEVIKEKQANPINSGNKKVLIFSAFADTVNYLYDNLLEAFLDNIGKITGGDKNKTTLKKVATDANTILTLFSPVSKEKELLMPHIEGEIDILVATDCVSEGQNLQDCDYLINYDIHWNPVRIIQRFGRIDRIGSINKQIRLVNFWPALSLDEYLSLKRRVESRMKIANISATGDDNPIDQNDTAAEYRKHQLERLREEPVDLEDVSGGISIMDLGLNEFRSDLLAFMEENKGVESAPAGMHAVTGGEKAGIIFVLKNINSEMNIEGRNRMHPFYIVYIGDDGETVSTHLEPKQTLDIFKSLCSGKHDPLKDLSRIFNERTNDGYNMGEVSALLSKAIQSIIETNEESLIDGLFSTDKTVISTENVKGLDDFELVCFLRVER